MIQPAAALAHLGEVEEAREALQKARELYPSLSMERWLRGNHERNRHPKAYEAIEKGLEIAGLD